MPGRDGAHGVWVYGVPVVLKLAVGGDGSLTVLTYRPYLLLGLLLQPVAVHRVPCLRRNQTKDRAARRCMVCARCALHVASCILGCNAAGCISPTACSYRGTARCAAVRSPVPPRKRAFTLVTAAAQRRGHQVCATAAGGRRP
jgi:hypothetical protein